MTNPIFLQSASDISQLPHDGTPEVAFFGRSNVGKSSLINSVLGTKSLARTSNTPGRTRLMNAFDSGSGYRLVDLPGYGFAKASKMDIEVFQSHIIDYLDGRKNLRLAVVVVDARIGLTDKDEAMMQSVYERDIPFIVVANKIDKLNRAEMNAMLTDLKALQLPVPIIPHSAETGVGRTEIRSAIQEAMHRR